MSENVPLDNSTALRNDIFHGWMPPSKTRSTTDILWTCLATIVLCVYSAVHLHIPEPGEAVWRETLRRAKWMIMAILAPELVLYSAWKQFNESRSLQSRLKEHAKRHRAANVSNREMENENESTLMINGSSESTVSRQVASANIEEIESVPDPEDITLTYAFYAVMGGFRLRLIDEEHSSKSYALNILAIDKFAELGFFWNISTVSIQDKSKADTVAKLLTVLQVVWMLAQCIARRVQNLPLAVLEIHTFVHATCAALMFAFWFKKPLNVRDATVRRQPPETQDLVRQMLQESEDLEIETNKPRLALRRPNFGRDTTRPITAMERIISSTDHDLGVEELFVNSRPDHAFRVVLAFFTVPAIYGCLHMIAWNAHFPTVIEKWLWRSACISVASGIFILCILVMIAAEVDSCVFWNYDPPRRHNRASQCVADLFSQFLSYVCVILDNIMWTLVIVLWVVVAMARGFIVIESVLSLRSVPIGVYAAVQWSNYIPHL